MKQIIYKNLKTSSLGFGCANLASDLRLSQAKDVLETALDQGITHFDVARSYGYGRCEYILGKFLRGRREKVTVATKFGNTMRQPPVSHHIINVVRRAVKTLPKLKAEVRSAVNNSPQESRRFSVAEAARSLDASLKEMNTDYIDLFLLHECSLLAANDPELIEFLEKAVQSGKIKYYGLATAFINLPANSAEISEKHSVIQTESSPLEKYITQGSSSQQRLFIGHSVFRELPDIHKKLSGNMPTQAQDQSPILALQDALKSGKRGLAELMLLNARRRNPHGIVLFSSTNKANIKTNVDVWISEANRLEEINALNAMISGLGKL
ncbi:MAG: aldo/keto reductase [Burkholderiales bacterium]